MTPNHIAAVKSLPVPVKRIRVAKAIRFFPCPPYICNIVFEDFRVPEVVIILVKSKRIHSVQICLACSGSVGVHVIGVPKVGWKAGGGVHNASVVRGLVDPLQAEEKLTGTGFIFLVFQFNNLG